MGRQVQVHETYLGGKETNKAFEQEASGRTRHLWQGCGIGIRGETVVTDQHAECVGLETNGFPHIRINQSVGEYVREIVHTNGIESFWALLKRGHYGIFHYMSSKHLHRYVNEFSFRHNTAQDGRMGFIEATICQMVGKRLTYLELTHG